ncbi:MAG: 2-oxoglutarate ferredoxin oxidoreductase subunit alpha [Ectothiorhodospiraceae bacterium]|nr:2-oxoglutarate ferredoxin oxidoreductase subunit alpha [Ectothiorhodospiraceae bacterium]
MANQVDSVEEEARQQSSSTLVELTDVTVRFAGDSGDGMQLTGSQFTNTTALLGNDLSTLPDYPAEIRAPAGTLYGVSGFQLHFSSRDIHTPGDKPDTLVAMNPAALKVNLEEVRNGGMIIVNEDAFDDKNMKLAGYKENPLDDDTLRGFKVFKVPITKLTVNALDGVGLSMKEVTRCKNFFALGLCYWLYNRPMEPTLEWINTKFAKNPLLVEGNTRALKAGYNFGEITERFTTRYAVRPANLPAGTYRNVTGNEAVALGMVTASLKANVPGFLGSYPITPASDILHELSAYKNYNFRTFQAEDEIAGICTAIGAAYGGSLAFTTTSGPGMALKMEAIGLALMVEIPLVIVNVQRGGPSTGLPTKTEQADLFQSILGRNGEAPVAVIAAQSPVDCFYMSIEAARIAVKYMTPVILLTDGYLANGSEPWNIPNPDDIEPIEVQFADDPETFQPYSRNEHLARPWAIPGTPGLEHRVGGLEKEHITGNVNYVPANHEYMVNLRAEKIQNIASGIPEQDYYGKDDADLAIVGWGGTFGAIRSATEQLLDEDASVAHIHVKYLNPFPENLGTLLKKYKKILVPELNLGQLAWFLRANYLLDPITLSKVQGLPFTPSEIKEKVHSILESM